MAFATALRMVAIAQLTVAHRTLPKSQGVLAATDWTTIAMAWPIVPIPIVLPTPYAWRATSTVFASPARIVTPARTIAGVGRLENQEIVSVAAMECLKIPKQMGASAMGIRRQTEPRP
jgi:hypothetical protein